MTVTIWRQLGSLRVRFTAVEDIRDGLTLIRCQGSHIDKTLHLFVARRRDDGAGIGVADKNDRPRHALKRAVERRDIIAERGQREGRGDDADTVSRERTDHLCPA